jgi:integrase
MTDQNNPDGKRTRYERIGDYVSIFLRGKTWYANWADADGRQRRRSLKTRSMKEARLRAMKLEAKIHRGEAPQRTIATTIEGAINAYDSFLVAEGRAKKTLSKYRNVFERIKALAEDRNATTLQAIDLAFSDAYRKMRVESGRQPKTIHVEMTVLKQLVNFCVRRNLIETNKLQGLKLKRPKPTQQPCWSAAEVQRILNDAVGSPFHPLFCLLAWTGMRIGEAKHLTWDDIDFERRVLRIQPKWVGPSKSDNWKPKSGDQRAIPLCMPAIALLNVQPRLGRWVFTSPPTRKYPELDRQIDADRTLYHLKKVLKALELPGRQHTFRHSLVTSAILSGVPEAVVRKWAGHLDAEILKLYTHIRDEDAKQHMDRLFPASDPSANGPGPTPEEEGGGDLPAPAA